MFKKLKDKLAEEVKSSPQRIQQFAQAAQAAVTSASSSISDITNTDLFSIGDNDGQQNHPGRPEMSTTSQRSTFQEVSLKQPMSSQNSMESMDFSSSHDLVENQRQRRLSNSSFASDVSFRLPSYESPSMFHLQSDMEVSASEAEERGFSGSNISLDRVTKEQIYAAYRRTQERYTKYRTQYADLARHYKLLERENAKAKSVLVETQDKALRRISELREQCTLEQSAKAHLEKAMREEIEEKNMKIETLNTKIKLLQNSSNENVNVETSASNENGTQLITLGSNNENKGTELSLSTEVQALNNKIEKLEQLVNKYKDSLKQNKEKSYQITVDLQKASSEIENKNKEIDELKIAAEQLTATQEQIQDLNDLNEELQNKINAYDFNKTKETSTLELDLQKSQEEIEQLRSKIEIFSKREEEYAISLAENKLSIHKELESKENEIKSLKDSLSDTNKEIQSLNIVVGDYKTTLASLEEEKSKLTNEIKELSSAKDKTENLEKQIQALLQKCQSLEAMKGKADEEIKFLQLQTKQETAEKLAMIDRNTYLESRNTQLSEENSKKNAQVKMLEKELQIFKENEVTINDSKADNENLLKELEVWKTKYSNLESEIQEERDELIKLQSEIEKLLINHEAILIKNTELNNIVSDIKSENESLKEKLDKLIKIKSKSDNLLQTVRDLKESLHLASEETRSLKEANNNLMPTIQENLNLLLSSITATDNVDHLKASTEELNKKYFEAKKELKNVSEQFNNASHEISLLQKEINELRSVLNDRQAQCKESKNEINILNEKHEKLSDELKNLDKSNQSLLQKLKEAENNCLNLQNINDSEKSTISKRIEFMQVENENFAKTNKAYQEKNVSLKKEIDDLRNRNEQLNYEISQLQMESDVLRTKAQKYDESNMHIAMLEQNAKSLEQDNMSLKIHCEQIANNFKDLELEITDVQKSHAEIEVENERLNKVLEALEKSAHKSMNNADTQTEDVIDSVEVVEKSESYKQTNAQPSNDLLSEELSEITEKHEALLEEHNIVKEDNRRLHSDIAGLQSYLTKISKENSELNDKLRESIASSENSPYRKDSLSNDIMILKNEIQSTKDKIEELVRENTLLIDENLELKDQINNQHFSPVPAVNGSDNKEFLSLKDKYNSLLDTKNSLEKKLMDIEQVSFSVGANMTMVQQQNEKLKLCNEKLERRLDEALVSLRHLHSLQENTELEYLRNILYEYLTGTGTHSETLAKVLAAVVKFDDNQTKQVLQKEKERQGLLRQLGLL